jgi:phage gp37-like protein
VSEGENPRLMQAVRRLMEGQQEALAIVRGVLEARDDARTDDALADLQDVLEGTLEDARADLGMEEGDEL